MNRLEYDSYIWEGRMSETSLKLSDLCHPVETFFRVKEKRGNNLFLFNDYPTI